MLYRTLAIVAALALGTFCASLAVGQEPEHLTEQLAEATGRVTQPDYFLVYRFEPGDVFRTEVTHLVTVETRMQGNTQTAQSRSLSTKAWEISDVNEEGNITLSLKIEAIDMWQNVSGQEPVSYNSRTDEKPPLEYEQAASTVGTVLATVTIDHHGWVIDREGSPELDALGFGSVAVPLPEGHVEVGHSWHEPSQVRVRLPDQRVQVIQIRHRYELTAVEENVATIQIRTEVLTPVDDPVVKSQLMQQLQNGEVKFDIEAGRLISKELDLDEMVIGFRGPNSMMKYASRYSEVAVDATSSPETPPAERQASRPAAE